MLAGMTESPPAFATDAFSTLLEGLPRERTRLLDNLVRIRREVGPITPERSDALADHMGIRRGEVAEVVSFYSYLRLPLDCLRVCTGPVCDCLGARELLSQAERLAPAALPVVEVPCLGHCDVAPVATRGDAVLPSLDEGLLRAAIEGEEVPTVSRRTNDGPSLGLALPDGSLAEYERRGGLAALRALPSPERVLAELGASGLVGYGGAGFPAQPRPRVVIVNADEGEPGTVKDRYILELRPHLLLEGMLIAARVVEAERVIVYIREEYALARRRLQEVLAEARAAGLLEGVTVEVVSGAGSYVCGEETALL
ncbi:MAG: hypothetical protein C4307_05125, partial [Chloroflexota bacterium]